ncbi:MULTISPECIES: hypothetical protein [unclassified Flavobacterium]|uniref:hypothetical protein n=1 Tax=unclassified Flavobacterium TaxID=196869 RepID=UPI000F28671D|nr:MULTISPECIES: hypothetical protein [unclassified Flavobacterium]RKS02476.1 hypothetical protein C8C84_2194 [Flavobacterium sp. 102]
MLFAILSVFHVNTQVSSYSFLQSDGAYTLLTGSTVLATQTVASGTAARALDDVNYTVALPFSFTILNS